MKRFYRGILVVVIGGVCLWYWQPGVFYQIVNTLYELGTTIVNEFESRNGNITPTDNANHYVSARMQNAEQVDSIYINTVVPTFKELTYSEIVPVMKVLKNTPAFDYALPYYLLIRDDYLENMQLQFDEYVSNVLSSFGNDIIPMILQEINEELAVDFEKILEKYVGTGGFKVIHDYDEFAQAWLNVIYVNKYNNILNGLMRDYDGDVLDFYSQYATFAPINIHSNFNTDGLKIGLPDDLIKEYTENENSNTIKVTLINGVFVVLDVATWGASTPVHIAVTTADVAYTGYELYQEFTADATKEEILCANMAQFVDMQILAFLQIEYASYLRAQNKFAFKQIMNTMEDIENNLCIEDNIEPIVELKKYYQNN